MSSGRKRSMSGADEPQSKRARLSDDGDEVAFSLTENRLVKVRVFRGKTYVDIREYYKDDAGEYKPGKKGISLTEDQWKKLYTEIAPKVNRTLGIEEEEEKEEKEQEQDEGKAKEEEKEEGGDE